MKKIQVNYDEAYEMLEQQFFNDLRKIEKKDLMREIKHIDHMGFALWMERMDWYISQAAHISNILFTTVQCGKLRFDEFAEALYEAAKMGYENYWSLKGKIICITDQESRQHYVFAPPTLMTLRKLLINDIHEWAVKSDKFEVGEIIEPMKIVKKRFGMEE